MSARPVAFATTELYPFSSGGIGRLVAELVRQALTEHERDVYLFVPASLGLTGERVRAEFGTRVVAEPWGVEAEGPPERSAALHAAIRRCGVSFEWIEFPEFEALGFDAIQDAAALPGRPSLRVRIHGPGSLIANLERERITSERARMFDLERACLGGADLVIAPSPAVLASVASFFRFDSAWRASAIVCFPPRPRVDPVVAPPSPPTRLVFPTKIQAIKRPDLFLRAAARITAAGWNGRVTIAAHRNRAIEDQLRRELDPNFMARVDWVAWSPEERRAGFAGQVIVVPSDFETLSLAAWEASASGARLVANLRCPAFSSESVWQRWEGFFGFDGTEDGLVEAMERALCAPAPAPFVVEADPFPTATRPENTLEVSRADFHVLTGNESDWVRGASTTRARWVVLARESESEDVGAVISHAIRVARRNSSLDVVATINQEVASPAQLWSTKRRPMGPLVLPAAFARSVLSATAGRRSALAVAQAAGLRVRYALYAGAVSLDDERFPPLYIDAHPVEVATQRDDVPPFRDEVLRRATLALGRMTRRALHGLTRT